VSAVPELVTLHVWNISTRSVPAAVWRMACDRRAIRRLPGVRFAKLLGTGSGTTFTMRDADLVRWALLTCWARKSDAQVFETSTVAHAWRRIATGEARVDLRPISARGRWARREPFGDPAPLRWDGAVAAITRARISPRATIRFWRAVPAVSAALAHSPGLQFAMGVGEAPVGLQGTFSLWESGDALTAFAYRGASHASVIERTPVERWYSEEFFARLAVLDVAGNLSSVATPDARYR
jgi:hypothetical protein